MMYLEIQDFDSKANDGHHSSLHAISDYFR